MASDEKGTGGLFFGPPEAPSEDAEGIGFAPDLDEGDAAAALFREDARVGGARPAPGKDAPTRSTGASYPLAEAALARLLGGAMPPAPVDESTTDDDGPFAIGPSIMRPPPGIARPAAGARGNDEADDDEGPRSRTDALMEDMVDMVLVGDDDGRHEVHLSFKEDVFGGLYLRLERREDGLFAWFHVGDAQARRAIESYADDMLARLRGRGMKIAGWDVVVREP